MSVVVAELDAIASAATELSRIGATIGSANAQAVLPTTQIAAAAADEVSRAVAATFGAFARDYQALGTQVAAFHDRVVGVLESAAQAYADAEAAGASLLAGGAAASAAEPPATAPALTLNESTALIMGPTGNPRPSGHYLRQVYNLYVRPFFPGAAPFGLTTPEQFQPFSGIPSLTFDESVARGASILHGAIMAEYAAGRDAVVLGFSQSASVATMEMRHLASLPADMRPGPDQLSFVLLGNPNNPNGGILARFPDVYLQPLGLTFSGATPDTIYPTTVYTRQYDGWADFPQYPLNVVSSANAILGIFYSHGTYQELTAAQIAAGIVSPVSPGATDITYVLIPTEDLPLLQPLRGVVPEPVLDLVQPNLRVIVEMGYDRTGYADVHTPAGLFPTHLDPFAVTADFARGTEQGVNAALFGLGLPQLPDSVIPEGFSLPIAVTPPALPAGIPVPPQLAPAISGPLDNLDRLVSTVINDQIDPVITSSIYQLGDSLSDAAISHGAPAAVVNAIEIGRLVSPILIAGPGYFVTSDLHYFATGVDHLVAGDLGGFNQYMQLIPATNAMFGVFGIGIGAVAVGSALTGRPFPFSA